MDYSDTIAVLKQQKLVLDQTIAALEHLAVGMPLLAEAKVERRGRKGMDPHEREIVSARMKSYWAARRSEKTSHAGSS